MLSNLLPIDVSTYGGDMDYFFWLIFWIVGIKVRRRFIILLRFYRLAGVRLFESNRSKQ